MRKICLPFLVLVGFLICQRPAFALLQVSDISDFLDFDFVGLQSGPAIVTPISSLNINEYYTITYGDSLDLVARITNVSNQALDLILRSDPATPVDPSLADLILSNLGGGASVEVVNGHFGPGLTTGLHNGNPKGTDGSILTLGVGEYIDYVWGRFFSSEIVPNGNPTDMIYALSASDRVDAFDGNGSPKIFGLYKNFGIGFIESSTAVIPEPSTLILLAIGLLGFFFRRQS